MNAPSQYIPLKAKGLLPEVDPDGIGQHDAGAKLDHMKIRAGLLEDFSLALMAVAEVLEHGAEKYSPEVGSMLKMAQNAIVMQHGGTCLNSVTRA
jgi:hypothetical protein